MKRFLPILLALIALVACEKKEDPAVTAISLDKTELTLKVGEKYQFKVSYMPADAKAPSQYNWSTPQHHLGNYDGYIAKVDQDGNIQAVHEGETEVTVELFDNFNSFGETIKAYCKIIVEPVKAEGIKLNKNKTTIKAGKDEILTYTITPETTTNKDVVWSSSDPKIVTVSNGIIKTVGAGTATISVTVKNTSIKDVCEVTVDPAKVEGLKLKESAKTIMQGESFKLTPVFTPEYATNKSIKWSSSNEKLAIVDNEGSIKTVGYGDCVIKGVSEDGGFEAICKLTVTPIPVQEIRFDNDYYKIEIGGQKQLSVTVLPENAGNKKIKWTSSNPTVVPIDEDGIIRGNTQGSITITATSEDGGYTATCYVYIVPINQMMSVYFPSSSVAIINGFYTGSISCAIRNNSSQNVKLKRFSVLDTNTYNTVAETTDESLLGTVLAPGQTIALSGRFNSVYEPSFTWEFEYNGRAFSTYNRYGDSSFSSGILKSAGKAKDMIGLIRLER